ncbi:hypothetical protein [Sorangium sp. So ce362]|uniref:hypothetical protein n=1 Tax=Sorangium sp. So ce362 TaxID=3133303 RepID=UPI003F5E7A5A
MVGGNACSAETVAGGPAVANPREGGLPSVGGKGDDELPDGAEDCRDGETTPTPNPSNYGRRGRGDGADVGCTDGDYGSYDARGTVGALGQGIGRISEAGWEANWAGDGGWGIPGQGGGGGGRRGGLGACGAASKGGAGGKSGRGGDSIGIATLDEDRLTFEGVTCTLGPPGKGGIRRDEQGKRISGEDGIAVETLRFPE